jgi:hypothetical protein
MADLLGRSTAAEVRDQIVDDVRDSEAAERTAAFKDKKNAYYCEECRGYIVTIDRDEGVTPMFLACRVKGDPADASNDCKGTSRSMMYPPEPWPEKDGFGKAIPTEPTWEWYAPDSDERKRLRRHDPGTFDHVDRGGLLLRPVSPSSPGAGGVDGVEREMTFDEFERKFDREDET